MTSPSDSQARNYAFDSGYSEAPIHMRLLAEILDGHSAAVLGDIGVGPGWRCLDVGPGAGTITGWLADRVRPGGQVVALDLDPQHVHPRPDVDLRVGDVRTAELPDGLDLIHARLVLEHLPEREAVVARLASALRPGGMLVVSDWECTAVEQMPVSLPTRAATEAFLAYQHTLCAVLVDAGFDLGWASRAPLAMRGAGLVDIRATVHNRLWRGGEAGCMHHAVNARQLTGELVARGMTVDQLGTLIAAMEDPQTMAYSYPLVTAVGARAS